MVIFYIIKFKLKNWQPNKGYHFPDSPYVEYIGNYDSNVQSNLLNALYLSRNLQVIKACMRGSHF